MKLATLALLVLAGVAGAQPRPQMADAEAARHDIAAYLGDWQPGAVAAGTPDFVVARDGSGTHRSLQGALDALPPAGARRHVIRVKPGTYREQACVQGKAPFTLLGDAADPQAVVLVAGHYNAERKRPGIDTANPCDPALKDATFGTAGSASVALFGDDVQVAHLTIANDAMAAVREGRGYPPGAGESGGAQGVALMTQGDRVLLDNVRLLGHQDTLYVRGGRVLVRGSFISGDVDFIFGDATLVVERSTIWSRAGRRTPGHGGHVLAPSTPAARAHGFLVTNSRLLAEPGVAPGSISLGRAWDHGVAAGAWQAGVSPNGQALVRDSVLGAHLGGWAASTSRRPFDVATHRFHEYRNTTQPALRDVAREVLAPDDGWAAADGGTRGGADAADGDIHEVRTRAELVAALKPHARPRIVQLLARIDLASDDQGRTLGAEAWRDPAFDWDAYARAYDPATWGRRAPEGPLEEARRRSAARQAAHVVLRVPSRTTLVGAAPGAGVANGMLLLDEADDVIIRGLHLSDAYDHFPAWDPKDNAAGEWNSEYDTLSLRGATRVWVDHCLFDDGQRPDSAEPRIFGRPLQRHDGLLDITRRSNHVTVSWNVFRHHDKTSLVGSSDTAVADRGRLKVSYHHNWWDGVKERAPRVRWGEVHVYNNLYTPGDGFGYSIGVGVQSRIVSEHNAWEGPLRAEQLVRLLKGEVFSDRGSLLNGQPVDLLGALRAGGAAVSSDVGWRPPHVRALDAAADVPARVRAGAGPLGL